MGCTKYLSNADKLKDGDWKKHWKNMRQQNCFDNAEIMQK